MHSADSPKKDLREECGRTFQASSYKEKRYKLGIFRGIWQSKDLASKLRTQTADKIIYLIDRLGRTSQDSLASYLNKVEFRVLPKCESKSIKWGACQVP